MHFQRSIFDSVLICAMRGIIETCPSVSLLPLSYALILVFAVPGSLPFRSPPLRSFLHFVSLHAPSLHLIQIRVKTFVYSEGGSGRETTAR